MNELNLMKKNSDIIGKSSQMENDDQLEQQTDKNIEFLNKIMKENKDLKKEIKSLKK